MFLPIPCSQLWFDKLDKHDDQQEENHYSKSDGSNDHKQGCEMVSEKYAGLPCRLGSFSSTFVEHTVE